MDDLAELTNLNETTLLKELKIRYGENKIYVSREGMNRLQSRTRNFYVFIYQVSLSLSPLFTLTSHILRQLPFLDLPQRYSHCYQPLQATWHLRPGCMYIFLCFQFFTCPPTPPHSYFPPPPPLPIFLPSSPSFLIGNKAAYRQCSSVHFTKHAFLSPSSISEGPRALSTEATLGTAPPHLCDCGSLLQQPF